MMKLGSKIKAFLGELGSSPLARRLGVGLVFSFTLYVLTYGILVARGERRARETGVSDYALVFSDPKDENYEGFACAVFWPIYCNDSVYADEKLYPGAMIPKNMSECDYVRHCKHRLLDCLGLN